MLTYNDVLDELQDYILDEDNIKKSLRIKVSSEKINKPLFIKSNIEEKSNLFVPRQQDTLFWCYYIMKNGDLSYETLSNKNSLLAKQMKIDLVSIIRKNKLHF